MTHLVLSCFSHVWLCDPMDCSPQAPLSLGFARKEAGVSCHALFHGIFPTQNWTCVSCLLHWQEDSLPLSHQRSPSGSPDKPRQHIKKQSYYFTNQDVSSQSCCFSSSRVYGCENWIIKKAECQRIDAFKLCCWRRFLRVSWNTRRSNQSILKEINPEYSLEGLRLKLKL